MRRAGVATRDPDPHVKDEYDAPNALYVPVTRPSPGQAVYETIGLLPGGFVAKYRLDGTKYRLKVSFREVSAALQCNPITVHC